MRPDFDLRTCLARIAVGAMLALAALPAGATDLRGRVEGQNAYSASPFALNGARVELVDRNGRTVGTYSTGPDGMYYFRNVAPGAYTLRVNKRSYPVTVEANVAQDIRPIRIQN